MALMALVIGVYWPALNFGYVQYDDDLYAQANTWVQQGLTLEGLAWAFTTDHASNWHPLTWLSLMLDVEIQRLLARLVGRGVLTQAAIHHAMNIALHVANVLLLFGVLRSMTGMLWRSAIVAGLLAVHPMHIESVAWVSERKDVLSMLFWLLTMWAYVHYTHDRRVPKYLLALVLAALSLMSKPMAVTLPLALLLLDFWPLQRMEFPVFNMRFWRCLGLLFAEKLPMLVMAVAVSMVTVLVQHQKGILTEGRWMTIPERLEMSIVAYARYLGKLFWPADLAALYPNLIPIGIDQWSTAQVAGAAALLVALSIVALGLLRRAPYLAVGWLWFLGTLVPVIGLVQVGRQSMADRYSYIPYVGLYVALVWLLGDGLQALAPSKRSAAQRLGAAAACAAIAALALAAHRQVYVWKDSVTLFAHAAAVTDRNWMMHNNLAAVLDQKGEREEALERLRQALAICPECAWVHQHYGEMLARHDRLAEAQLALERALELDPDLASAHANLGIVLTKRQQPTAALLHLRRAVELRPKDAESRKSLAIALAVQGQSDEAMLHMQEALRLAPEKAAQWGPILESIGTGATRGMAPALTPEAGR